MPRVPPHPLHLPSCPHHAGGRVGVGTEQCHAECGPNMQYTQATHVHTTHVHTHVQTGCHGCKECHKQGDSWVVLLGNKTKKLSTTTISTHKHKQHYVHTHTQRHKQTNKQLLVNPQIIKTQTRFTKNTKNHELKEKIWKKNDSKAYTIKSTFFFHIH